MSKKTKHAFLGALALGVILFVTGPKLIYMSQVRGFIRGAIVSSEDVLSKWHETNRSGKQVDVYWVSWRDLDIEEPSGFRLNLPEAVWSEIDVGDSVELIYLRDLRNDFFPGHTGYESFGPYHESGIFASNGNFTFDIALLLFLLFLVVRGISELIPRKIKE